MKNRLTSLSPYWLWLLLALPAFAILGDAMTSDSARIYHRLVHPSGEWSARLLIFTLMISPLALLFKGRRWPRWLKKNRRYFGVAAFGYAALHTMFYLIDKASFAQIMAEAPRFYIWTGWVAFAIFIPLAATSVDFFVRRLGPWWKWVQRWTYLAAVLTLLHWAALHEWKHPAVALLHFAPLALLEAYRIWYWYLRPRPDRSLAA